MLTSVVVYVGKSACKVRDRSSGGLTGSQLALLLSGVPVQSCFAELTDDLSPAAFRTDVCCLKAAAYNDNLYTVSDSASGAVSQMEMILSNLSSTWGLLPKPGSRRIIAAKGADTSHDVGAGWIIGEVSEVLGWIIQSDGDIDKGWRKLTCKMWKAFYANVKAPGWRRLGSQRRLSLLSRSIRGLVEHGVAVFPPQHFYGCDLDRLQRKMVSAAMENTRLPTEDWVTF